jgi:hypothetical protein
MDGFRAQGAHFARGVSALEGREVDHGDSGVDRPRFRCGLDAAGRESGRARFRANLIDTGVNRTGTGEAQRRLG